MTAPFTSFAWHLEQLGEHPCCWIVSDGKQCGLLCGHGGGHAPFVPGDYLRPPGLHPLDVARFMLWGDWRCLLCRGSIVGGEWRGYASGWDRKWQGRVRWVYVDSAGRPEYRDEVTAEWRFLPCGCQAREVTG